MKNLIILFFMLVFLPMLDSQAKDTRIPVVVIDTGISNSQAKKPYICEGGVLSTVEDNGIDENGHGDNIIGIIASKINKKYCIVSIKVYKKTTSLADPYVAGLKLAIELHPAFINISMDGSDPMFLETLYIQRALIQGSKVIVAAGNSSLNLDKGCRAFPTCAKNTIPAIYSKNMFTVGATDTETSNYGKVVTHRMSGKDLGFPKMSGTSQAAANLTSQLVKE
jgi:putative component of membrane protein insertase Oxa1/YidC/SpoIIIJ protein YidD